MKFVYFSMLLLALSCSNPNPNVNELGEDELKSLEIDREIDFSELSYNDVVYVPIYSDIYIDQQHQNSLLAATLSIRNTSAEDSLIVSTIDYYNTEGDLVRSYIENPISMPPMATVNYVVEKEDDTGGPGANFIVNLSGSSNKLKPIIQAVMIGQNGNKGFAFSTDGYSVM